MTVEQLIDGVVSALRTFDRPVYTERNEMDLETPSFFVRSYRQQNDQRINGRFIHTIDVEVLYFPGEPGPMDTRSANAEMHDISDKLMYLLRIIEANGEKVLARGIEANISDGTLVVTFSVEITERVAIKVDPMETHTVGFMVREDTVISDKG